MSSRTRSGPAAAMVAAVLVTGACGGARVTDPGWVKIQATLPAASADQIDHVILTVSAVGTPGAPPIFQAPLSRDADGFWSVSVESIPAGRYTFALDAYDVRGTRLYAGSVTAAVSGGATTRLGILVQQVDPGDPGSSTPVITAVSVSPEPVAPGASATVSVEAHSPDGLELGFLWQDACGGSFQAPTSPTTIWTAPAAAPTGACLLTIRVAETGASASLFLAVQVR